METTLSLPVFVFTELHPVVVTLAIRDFDRERQPQARFLLFSFLKHGRPPCEIVRNSLQ